MPLIIIAVKLDCMEQVALTGGLLLQSLRAQHQVFEWQHDGVAGWLVHCMVALHIISIWSSQPRHNTIRFRDLRFLSNLMLLTMYVWVRSTTSTVYSCFLCSHKEPLFDCLCLSTQTLGCLLHKVGAL